MTPKQLRMARASLNVTQSELAEAIETSANVISGAEAERTKLSGEYLNRLQTYFKMRGLEFTDNNGVRDNPSGIRIYRGKEGFREFYDYQYNILRKKGGDIWLYNGVSQYFIDALGPEFLKAHVTRMTEIKDKINYRVIVEENDTTAFGSSYAEYRGIPSDQFNDKTIFVLPGMLAIVDFSNEILVTVIENEEVASTISKLMLNSWGNANAIS